LLRHVPSKATAVVGALLLFAGGFVVSQAAGAVAGTPADKPFAAASKAVKTGPGTRVQLLSATVHNSKTSDIVLLLSMECSIITDNVIAGSTVPGAQESATTQGDIRAWVEIDGQTVPIVSSSTPPQNPPPPGNATDKVTFCSRVFNRTQSDNEQDGLDKSRDYLATKTSNSFNWVRLNMGAGDHTIVVYGDLTTASSTGSTASAYIGNRSLIGLPGKFANDAVISDVSTQ
jgi:hypothetical protein